MKNMRTEFVKFLASENVLGTFISTYKQVNEDHESSWIQHLSDNHRMNFLANAFTLEMHSAVVDWKKVNKRWLDKIHSIVLNERKLHISKPKH